MSQLSGKLSDVSSLETLLQAVKLINKNDDGDAASQMAALARRYRDILSKHSSDVEAFLMECEAEYSTPIIIAGLLVIFDSSNHKHKSDSSDHVLRIFTSYIEEDKFVFDHVKLCPDLFFPLSRKLVTYLIESRNDARSAVDLSLKILKFAVDPLDDCVTSFHSAFLCGCILTGEFELADPYLHHYVKELSNECSHSYIENNNTSSIFNEARKSKGSGSFFDSKFLLQYFYYGGTILAKLGDLKRALLYLESCIVFPGSAVSLIQIDAYKRYHLLSLIIHGHMEPPSGKSAALTRCWKSRSQFAVYGKLVNAVNAGGNRVENVEKLLTANREVLENDKNLGLVEQLIHTLKENAILNVAKSFSSILLKDLADRAFCTSEEILNRIESLIRTNRLKASIDQDLGVIHLEPPIEQEKKDSSSDVLKRLTAMEADVRHMDLLAQLNPALLSRTIKGSSLVSIQDDEGLSMTPGHAQAE